MIAKIWKKGKEQLAVLENPDFFIAILIILVAFASFSLGRLSKIKTARVPLKIEQMAAVVEAIGDVKNAAPTIAAKSISEANKIWFNSVEEARAAGYAPASNCKGLE